MNRLAICLIGLTISLMVSTNASAMYDPGLGRFCSRDPIGFVAKGQNLQSYIEDRPLFGIDPLGLDWGNSDFVNHYWRGFGVPVSLTQIGLADDFERFHSARIDAKIQAALARAESIPYGCPDGPGVYTKTVPVQITPETWSSFNMMFSLGSGWVYFSGLATATWNCEYCCARTGDVRITQVDAYAFINFAFHDAFTNPMPGYSDDWQMGDGQGRCVNKCYNKFANKLISWRDFLACQQKCRLQFPTHPNDYYLSGVPYGIHHAFTRTLSSTKPTPCD